MERLALADECASTIEIPSEHRVDAEPVQQHRSAVQIAELIDDREARSVQLDARSPCPAMSAELA